MMACDFSEVSAIEPVFPSQIEVLDLMAESVVSKIWRVRHSGNLKILKYAQSKGEDNPYLLGQFEREYESSRWLTKNGLASCTCQISDFDIDEEGHPWLLMSYFPSQSLENMKNELSNWNILKNILKNVIYLISEIHRIGVIHRDIKPSNFLINEQGEMRMIDFSLSVINGEWHRYHEENVAHGTPVYMSPEQACGLKSELTEASDWYSLGVMIFEWIYGCYPFLGATIQETLAMHCLSPVPQMALNERFPPELFDVCQQFLSKNSSDRMLALEKLKKYIK